MPATKHYFALILSLLLICSCGAFADGVVNNTWTRADAAHLLRRAGFGGTPAQIDGIFNLGRENAVEYLLTGKLPDGSAPIFPAVTFEEFKPTPQPEVDIPAGPKKNKAVIGEAPATQPDPATQAIEDKKKALAKEIKSIGRQDLQRFRIYWLDRMIRTDRPLEEKMTLFWHGLFTSGYKEVKNPEYLIQQNEMFRHEALGNYKQLADDAVHGAAVLKYLNNDENIKGKPNENLAREMMELFTMGEGHGYTETDIKEAARALTGLAPSGGKIKGDGTVVLRRNVHDSGQKTIFGLQTGNFGPDDIIKLIFAKPEPAQYLAKKLWEFYVAPDPSDADLAPVISAIQQNNFELKPTLRVIFNSPAFYSDKAKFALIKSPTELVVEQERTLGHAPTEADEAALIADMNSMNQELFQPPNVRGWVGGDNWITAATLYTSYNTASSVINGTLRGGAGGKGMKNPRGNSMNGPATGPNAIDIPNLFTSLGATASPEKMVDAAIDLFVQRPIAPDKRAALLEIIGTQPIRLADPRVREMICLLLSTPEYQLH